MAERWEEKVINLQPNTPYRVHSDAGFNAVIVKNLSSATIYAHIRPDVNGTNYETQITAYGWGVIVRNYMLNDVYLFSSEEVNGVTVNLVTTDNPIILIQNMIKSAIATDVNVVTTAGLKASELNLDANKKLGVNVASLPSLPAGSNKIGSVDIASPIPAGTNKIGQVDVTSLPALPAGTNKIGRVDADNTNIDLALTAFRDAILGLYNPITAYQSSTGEALTVTLDCGGRPFMEVWVKSSAEVTFTVYASRDNVNWRQVDVLSVTAGEEYHKGYQNAYRYIKVETLAEANNEIEITASR